MRILNTTRGTELASEAKLANTHWTRLAGLMGRKTLPDGHALVIEPCSSVHMMFMRFPIDVVYVDREWQVVKTAEHLRPYTGISFGGRGARRAIELPAGAVSRSGTSKGDALAAEE